MAFIPAREGSKGLPGKNIRPLAGLPLYKHAVRAAQMAGIHRIFVSTDIPEILVGSETAFDVIERSSRAASDLATMADVLREFVEKVLPNGKTIVLLQPTSPLRTDKHIAQALDLYHTGEYEMVLTATETDKSVLKCGTLDGNRFVPVSKPEFCFSNRQELPEVYRPNGAVFVFDSKHFTVSGDGFPTQQLGIVKMSPEESHDIDTIEDFDRCETLFEQTRGK